MKKFITFLLCFSSLTFASHHDKSENKEEMMKAMMEYSTPGKEHERMGKLAGSWKYTSKGWEAPDKKPEETKGTAKFKMVLENHFLQQEIKGVAMGKPFSGLGFLGFDNLKKQYNTIWLDSMGTGMLHGIGSYDEKTQTYHDKGEFSCPIVDSKTGQYRSEWKIVDNKNMIFNLYATIGDKPEYKMMEMIYFRK